MFIVYESKTNATTVANSGSIRPDYSETVVIITHTETEIHISDAADCRFVLKMSHSPQWHYLRHYLFINNRLMSLVGRVSAKRVTRHNSTRHVGLLQWLLPAGLGF